jgi:DNA-binding MarR family transcriptional regulator
MTETLSSLDALRFWYAVLHRSLVDMPHDLSHRQLTVLLHIYMMPPQHTVRGLSQELGISKPAICRAIDTLSRLDLVKRKKDPEDRRNVFIQRTIAGSVFLRDFGDVISQEYSGAEG